MDESKPPIPPNETRLRSASERIAAAIDPAPPPSSELAAVEQQSRSDGSSVAVFYRNEEEVRDGFLTALRAMGIADIRREVFSRLLSLSPGWFEEARTGEVISRLTTDTALLEQVVGTSVSMALRNGLLIHGPTHWAAAVLHNGLGADFPPLLKDGDTKDYDPADLARKMAAAGWRSRRAKGR